MVVVDLDRTGSVKKCPENKKKNKKHKKGPRCFLPTVSLPCRHYHPHGKRYVPCVGCCSFSWRTLLFGITVFDVEQPNDERTRKFFG